MCSRIAAHAGLRVGSDGRGRSGFAGRCGCLGCALNFRRELWMPGLSNRQRHEAWKTEGGKRLSEKLNLKVRQILAEHMPTALTTEQARRMLTRQVALIRSTTSRRRAGLIAFA